MANGFFLGGEAEGIASAQKQDLAERTLAQDTGLRTRGLDIQQKTLEDKQQRDILTRVDQQVTETMSLISEAVKSLTTAGKSPLEIERAIAPLIPEAKKMFAAAKRDPALVDAQVKALLASPTALETAKATGTAEGVKAGTKLIAEDATLRTAEGGSGPDLGSKIRDPKQKAETENALRDDFIKQSDQFIKVRDAKNRLDNIETTGAGDVALVFTFMKILDPGSTVREGEFATASNSGGVPASVQALYNKMLGGGVLAKPQRDQIKSQANKFFETAAVQHDKLATQFAKIAKSKGLNPNNVAIDLKPAGQMTTPGGRTFRIVQ